MCDELVQSCEAAEGHRAAAILFVLHREMERYMRRTVRGIDEQKIERLGYFNNPTMGL